MWTAAGNRKMLTNGANRELQQVPIGVVVQPDPLTIVAETVEPPSEELLGVIVPDPVFVPVVPVGKAAAFDPHSFMVLLIKSLVLEAFWGVYQSVRCPAKARAFCALRAPHVHHDAPACMIGIHSTLLSLS